MLELTDAVRTLLGQCISISEENGQSKHRNLNVNILAQEAFSQYDTLQLHLMYYPYNRSINAKNISFRPYDSYIQDALAGQQTLYYIAPRWFNSVFGLCIGLFFTIIFWFVNPTELTTLESIASIIGLYFIGKELWTDIELFFERRSEKWRLRLYPRQFTFQREKDTSLAPYQDKARFYRYGTLHPQAEKLETIKQSNSHLIKLEFATKDLLPQGKGPVQRILRIQPDQSISGKELVHGMFSVKIALQKKRWFWVDSLEILQGWDSQGVFCIRSDGTHTRQAAVVKYTQYFGRIKWYRKIFIEPDFSIITVKTA